MQWFTIGRTVRIKLSKHTKWMFKMMLEGMSSKHFVRNSTFYLNNDMIVVIVSYKIHRSSMITFV